MENKEPSDELLDVAGAIGDGQDQDGIDWATVRQRVPDKDGADLLSALQSVEKIASAHRELQRSTDDVGRVLRGRDGRSYTLLEEMGRGGMGVVFKACDERGHAIALKRLRSDKHVSIERFKREFRTLVTISDEPENLATLYHLDADDEGAPFFTMELVEGVNFIRYVRGSVSAGAPPDADRLHHATTQLVRALTELHAKSKLHRDIKPSNVLVGRDGKVVVVDFGLSADADDTETTVTDIQGTPSYMSPEQAEGRSGTPASDWYSVGIMLYEALTGKLPFRGTLYEIVEAKRSWEPPVPEQGQPLFEDLCRELLSIDPDLRPSGLEILRRLGVKAPKTARMKELFVGRRAELERLEDLFELQGPSRTSVVLLHGPSGVGKTSIVERFLKGHARDEDAVLLKGRCFERESVPYKALDSVVDHLTRYLRRQEVRGRHNVHAYLPSDMAALVHVFPAFEDVESARAAARQGRAVRDRQELRKRAFDALRELLAKVGQWKKLVLFIDDLQWGDADSAAVFNTLMQPPNPPPLLLIGCYRDTEVGQSPLLPELLRMADSGQWAADVHPIEIAELEHQEATGLAAALMPDGVASEASVAEAIARESGGNPLFIAELARNVGDDASTPTLDEAIGARIDALPEPARLLLELVAVAGKPIDSMTLEKASGTGTAFPDARIALESAQLVRSLGSNETEAHHDRIRMAVLSRIEGRELQNLHLRLAQGFPPSADPETLAVHFELGGDLGAALDYTEKAAERAMGTLAFERAARLFRRGLELAEPGTERAFRLRVALGDALANAGLGLEAATIYLEAMADVDEVSAIGLQRRAAEQLLMSGHIDRGIAELDQVFDRLNIRPPRSTWEAMVSIVTRRPFRRGRRYRFQEHAENDVSIKQLHEVDALFAAVKCLGLVDNVRGAAFQAKHLASAERVGEPFRVCRAWAMQALYVAASGPERHGEALQLVQQMDVLSRRVEQPYARALVPLVRGMASLLQGYFHEAQDGLTTAEHGLLEYGTGVAYEIDMARIFSLYARWRAGRWKALFEKLPSLLQDASQRGDIFASTNYVVRYGWLLGLARNRPDVVRPELERYLEQWSKELTSQHYNAAKARAETALYERSEDVLDAAQKASAAGKKARLLRVQYLRIDTDELIGRAAIASACLRDRPSDLAIADHSAAAIEKEGTHWGRPIATLLRAGVASVRGNQEEAAQLLESAAADFERAGMDLWATAATRRLAEIEGGDAGADKVAACDDALRREDVEDPEAMLFLLAPGKWT